MNLASRVGARATGGEVLVTREVRAVAGRHLAFQPIGEVKLKGFDEATELFLAASAMIDVERPDGARRSVVLLSGGRDSVCLLDLAVRLAGPVVALHVNYGLRAGGGRGRGALPGLCERLGSAAGRCAGQGRRRATCRRGRGSCATPRRPERAERARSPSATRPPTRPRPCSTGSSRRPGGARCWGCRAGRGRMVRPLLGVTRAETAAYCAARGLAWREDPTNATTTRGRIRRICSRCTRPRRRTCAHARAGARRGRVLDTLIDYIIRRPTSTDAPARARPADGAADRRRHGAEVAEHMETILALARARPGRGTMACPAGLRSP